MSVIEIESDDHFTEITSNSGSDKLCVLFFHTPSAVPCVQIAKVFGILAAANPEINFISINVETHESITEVFEISSVPHFVFVKDSVILKELSGTDPKELAAALEDYKNGALAAPGSEAQPPASTASFAANPAAPATASASALAPAPAASAEEETEEQLNERLTKLTSAAPVMVFIKGTPSEPKCGFSRQLVAILREHQVKFGFFDILKDNSVRQGLKTFSDWPTFPQLYINGEFQGGLDIVKESLEDDPNFFETALNA